MSILGFSIVGISKMISIFILGYPQPPQGALGGGFGGAKGGIPPKIKCYVNFGVFNSGYFKNDIYFHFWLPRTPARAPQGGLGGPEGVYWCYIDFGVFNSGNSILKYPKTLRAPPGGGWGVKMDNKSYIIKNHVLWHFHYWGIKKQSSFSSTNILIHILFLWFAFLTMF